MMKNKTNHQTSNSYKRDSLNHTQRWGPPFWTTVSIISLVINAILIAFLLGLGSQIFQIKNLVQNQLLGGLSENFAAMDDAHIRTTIPVRDQTVQANFDLTIQQETVVELSQDVYIKDAEIFDLYTQNGGLKINYAKADIRLPAGSTLPIHLSLIVPVDQAIPVDLDVEVDIPLNQSDLHAPFTGLQDVVDPYLQTLADLPDSWMEVFCGKHPAPFCAWLFQAYD